MYIVEPAKEEEFRQQLCKNWAAVAEVQRREYLSVEATLEGQRRRVQQAKGILTLAADENMVFAEATGFFLPLPDEVVHNLIQDVPGIHDFFSQDPQ